MEKVKKILIISTDNNLRDILNFCFDGWGYEVVSLHSASEDITTIKKNAPDVIVVDVHSARHDDLDLCRLLKNDFVTNSIPIITLIDKRHLRSQLLNIRQGVDDYLIKPPDPLDLRVRIEMALRRSQYSFNSSPLTGLPSARLIEETLKERLKKNSHFSFAYVDIDNFKFFNDIYGYIKGDSVIMQTAYMLYSTIKKIGNPDDFIGHIGGDDFVFITTPDKINIIARQFIDVFDNVMPFHYSAEHRKQNFITAKDRSHKLKKTPLMSVSISCITRDERSDFKNIIQINEILTEIKQHLKIQPGSKFMAERRNRKVTGIFEHSIYKTKDESLSGYRPLGQILIERGDLTQEHLDDALKIHWKRGLMLGETLKELKIIDDEKLKQALGLQVN